MSPDDKARIIADLTRTVCELALAGVRARHPHETPRQQSLRMAIVMLGPELARQAYPEIASLP
jgi:hypothetical protein